MKTPNQLTTTALIALAVLATACGGTKTNPVSDYQDLKGIPPSQKTVTKPQNLRGMFIAMPSAGDQIFNFFEGQAGQYVLESRALVPGVVYKLKANGLPEGASFVQSNDPAKPGTYVLSWKPRVGTLNSTEKGHRNVRFSISIEVVSSPEPLVMEENGRSENYVLTLYNTSNDPAIVSFKLGSAEVVQGDLDAITVEVSDPGASQASVPKLIVRDDKVVASELGEIKAARYVSFEAPTRSENGNFVFSGKLDTSSINFPKGKNVLTAHFNVQILGAAGGKSIEQAIDIKIDRKTETKTDTKTDSKKDPAPSPTPQPTPTAKDAKSKDAKKGTQK